VTAALLPHSPPPHLVQVKAQELLEALVQYVQREQVQSIDLIDRLSNRPSIDLIEGLIAPISGPIEAHRARASPMPTPCQPHANPVPTPCQPHANPMPSHANPMPTHSSGVSAGTPVVACGMWYIEHIMPQCRNATLMWPVFPVSVCCFYLLPPFCQLLPSAFCLGLGRNRTLATTTTTAPFLVAPSQW
jgi:hypothetical protein